MAALVACGGLAASAPAFGQAVDRLPERPVHKLIITQLPNWQVGDIDKRLSRLCSMGQFNQRVPLKYVAQFRGPTGSALIGGAKGEGLNLFDPTGAARADTDYWFHRDRTSNCVVYTAKVRPQSQPAQN